MHFIIQITRRLWKYPDSLPCWLICLPVWLPFFRVWPCLSIYPYAYLWLSLCKAFCVFVCGCLSVSVCSICQPVCNCVWLVLFDPFCLYARGFLPVYVFVYLCLSVRPSVLLSVGVYIAMKAKKKKKLTFLGVSTYRCSLGRSNVRSWLMRIPGSTGIDSYSLPCPPESITTCKKFTTNIFKQVPIRHGIIIRMWYFGYQPITTAAVVVMVPEKRPGVVDTKYYFSLSARNIAKRQSLKRETLYPGLLENHFHWYYHNLSQF